MKMTSTVQLIVKVVIVMKGFQRGVNIRAMSNNVLKGQLIVLSQFYNQTSSPIKFNKVNGGIEVNKVAALQILEYCEERHMSRTEAEEYLKSPIL